MSEKALETETIDRLFLELSQVTNATTKAELSLRATLAARESELAAAQRQRDHYYKACVSHEAKIAEAAATALGYPRFCDMEPINPHDPADVESQSKDTNRFYGEHVSDTLVDELCRKYVEAQRRVAELEGDAERYRYIRDTLAQMLNPKMSGQHTWRVTTIHATGGTFEEALDKHMAERPIKADRITPTEPEK